MVLQKVIGLKRSRGMSVIGKRLNFAKTLSHAAGVDLGIFVTSSTLEPKYV